MKHTLEQYKVFPILVWLLILVALFAIYKFSIVFSYRFNSLGDKQDSNKKALEVDLYHEDINY